MLFEKKLRKKRISPFYAEVIAGLIYAEFLAWIVFLTLLILVWPPNLVLTLILLFFPLILMPAASLADMRPASARCFHLLRDKKKGRIITSDLLLLDYGIGFASYFYSVDIKETFTHLMYKEPCMRIVYFMGVPLETEVPTWPPLRFYIMEVHFSCRLHGEFEAVCEEYNKMVDDLESGALIMDFGERPLPKQAPVTEICFYLTYEKVHVLNELFSLVNPPAFRLTSYERSGVLRSIGPVPGREYPPAALACMEKINDMYP